MDLCTCGAVLATWFELYHSFANARYRYWVSGKSRFIYHRRVHCSMGYLQCECWEYLEAMVHLLWHLANHVFFFLHYASMPSISIASLDGWRLDKSVRWIIEIGSFRSTVDESFRSGDLPWLLRAIRWASSQIPRPHSRFCCSSTFLKHSMRDDTETIIHYDRTLILLSSR